MWTCRNRFPRAKEGARDVLDIFYDSSRPYKAVRGRSNNARLPLLSFSPVFPCYSCLQQLTTVQRAETVFRTLALATHYPFELNATSLSLSCLPHVLRELPPLLTSCFLPFPLPLRFLLSTLLRSEV
jgi:hypothetical protein